MRRLWYGVLSIGCAAGWIFAGCGDRPEAPTGPSSSAGSGGSPGGCQTAKDCPAPTMDCVEPVCTDGSCGTTPVMMGMDAVMQTAGDCKKRVCDGMGGVTVADDDADVPDDMNPCTSDTCTGGSPAAHTAVAPAMRGQCKVSGTDGVCGDPSGTAAGTCVDCNVDTDCTTQVCGTNHTCLPAACGDGVKNGSETDVDCGGSCSPCPIGEGCLVPADCQSHACTGNVCQPSCTDGIQNQGEVDVDCAGPCAQKCGPGKKCTGDGDCTGGLCASGTCAPTCTDGVKNDAETDVDCGGGTCLACDLGKGCAQPSDCANTFCIGDVCSQINGCDPLTALDMTGQANVSISFGAAVGDAYSPSCIKVTVGTKVTFKGDFGTHPFQGGVVANGNFTPATTGPFATVVSTGATASFTMSAAGSFGYFCQAHGAFGMYGAVLVQ